MNETLKNLIGIILEYSRDNQGRSPSGIEMSTDTLYDLMQDKSDLARNLLSCLGTTPELAGIPITHSYEITETRMIP